MTTSGLLAYNWQVLLPLLARNTFHGDAQVAGLMFTAMGLGAVVGGLAVAGSLQVTTNRLVITGMIFAGSLVAVAPAPTLALSLGVFFVVGAASVTFRAIATSLVQLRAAPEMRGRVVALLIMATNGTTPIGGPFVGWICQSYGARSALLIAGTSTAVGAACTYIYIRRGRLGTRTDEAVDIVLSEDITS